MHRLIDRAEGLGSAMPGARALAGSTANRSKIDCIPLRQRHAQLVHRRGGHEPAVLIAMKAAGHSADRCIG